VVQATYIHDGDAVDHTPSLAVASGDVVVSGEVARIAKLAIAASALGALATRGVFDVAKATGAWTDGEAIYWDDDGDPLGGTPGSGAATTTVSSSSGDGFLGFAIGATASSTTTGRLNLIGVPSHTHYDPLSDAIADPGDAAAIPVTGSGTCLLTTAASETRTLAIPTFAGQKIMLVMTVRAVGDAVVTTASAINETGDNTLTFGVAGDAITLVAVLLGATLAWRVVSNMDTALSTA